MSTVKSFRCIINSKPVIRAKSNTEQYQDIPGAEIIFPKVGIYDLEMTGSAKDGKSFKPFKFNYFVTVT